MLIRLSAYCLFGALLVLTPRTIYGQDVDPPAVSATPNGTVTTSPISVTIEWCDDNTLVSSSRSITLNGVNVTSSFNYSIISDPNCGTAAQSVGTVNLNSGQNALVAQIRDVAFNWGSLSTTLTLAGPVDVVPFRASDGASIGANGSGSNTQLFRVKNAGTVSELYVLSTACSGSVTCGSPSPGTITLAGGDSAWVSLPYTAGTPGTTGVVKLHAADGGVTNDGWVNVTNQYLAVSTTMNNFENEKLSLCEADCFAAVQRLTTVPYFSLDQPRSVTLVYNSDQTSARPFVIADVSLASGASTPSEYWLQAQDSAGNNITFLNGDTKLRFTPPTNSATIVRLAGQFDASAYGTGVYPIKLIVSWATGAPASANETRTVLTNFLVINERKSPIARGWTVAALQHLVATQGGALVTDGDGSAVFYQGCGTDCYSRPQGEFASLTSNGTGGSKVYSRIYPDSSVAVFNSSGYLVRMISRLQDTVTFTYDGSNRLTQITDPFRTNGSSTHLYTQLSYGANGLSSIQEPGLGNSQTGGRTTTVSVGSDSTLSTWTDPDNVATRLLYDSRRRLSGFVNRHGDTTTYTYQADSSWKMASIVSPRFIRDDGTVGQITTTYNPWQTASVPYSSTGSVMKQPMVRDSVVGTITDHGGHLTRFTVNRFGQALLTIAAAGTNRARVTTRYMSPTYGVLPDSVRRHEGGIDRFTYNSDGLALTTKPAGETTISYHYGPYAQIDSVSGSRRPTQRYILGSRGRVDTAKVLGSTVYKTSYSYDARQRPTSVVDPGGHTTYYHYESVYGNRHSLAGPAGRYAQMRFDGMGRDSASRDTGGPWTRRLYDNCNRVLKVYHDTGTSPTILADSVRYTFDNLYLTQVKDGLGQAYGFQHNALGVITQRTDPAGNSDRYAYNAEGLPTRWINRRGDTVFTTYDVVHRVLANTGSQISARAFSFDSAGLISVRSNATARDSIVTDTNGWLTTLITRFATDSIKRFAVSYTPDSLHRIIDVSPSTSTGIVFATRTNSWDDATGVLTSITVNGSQVAQAYNSDLIRSGASYTSGLTRTDAVTTAHRLYQQGFNSSGINADLWRSVYLDARGRAIESYESDGDIDKRKMTYRYDPLGRLVERTDSVLVYQNQCTGTPDPDYGGRLCTGYTAGADGRDTLLYDAVGNITSSFGTAGNGGATYVTGNRISSWPGFTFTHDSAGNVTRKHDTSSGVNTDYMWSADGLLMRIITGSDTTFYDYDAAGQLVRKRKGNGVISRHFWWEGSQLLAQLDSTLTKRVSEYAYYPGIDKPAVLMTGATSITNTYHYQQDAFGNAYALVKDDGTETNYMRNADAWGLSQEWVLGPLAPGDTNRLQWKGLIRENSLYYARARWYDPQIHRFLSEDPSGLGGGVNPYVFGGNDPLNNADPTGTKCTPVWSVVWEQFGPKGMGMRSRLAITSWECWDDDFGLGGIRGGVLGSLFPESVTSGVRFSGAAQGDGITVHAYRIKDVNFRANSDGSCRDVVTFQQAGHSGTLYLQTGWGTSLGLWRYGLGVYNGFIIEPGPPPRVLDLRQIGFTYCGQNGGVGLFWATEPT